MVETTYHQAQGLVICSIVRREQSERSRDNNAMHAKSGLRVVLKWKIYRPDSVIAGVIPHQHHG